MKKAMPVLACLLALAGPVPAQEPPAAPGPPPPVSIDGKTMPLNDVCARRKFVIDNCVGSLYTPRAVATEEEVLAEPGDRLLRLDITEERIERERLMGAFEEGFMNYAPDVARSPDAKRFLSLFKVDFYRGDRVDLFLGGDGTVKASHNGRDLGSLNSSPLVRGILKSWFARKPGAGKAAEPTPGN
jgi:hypothetical protein